MLAFSCDMSLFKCRNWNYFSEIFSYGQIVILQKKPCIKSMFEPIRFLTSKPNPSEDITVQLGTANDDKIVELNVGDTRKLKFHTTWLRHQCRCSSCFNQATFQSNIKLSPKLLEMKPEKIQHDNNTLSIIWNDNHETTFEMSWLRKNDPFHTNAPNNLFQMQHILKPSSSDSTNLKFKGELLGNGIDFREFLENQSALERLLQNIVVFGFGVIKNSPADVAATEIAAERVSHMQRTMFGYGCCVINSNQVLEHKDTAYTSEYLAPHTDTTYFNEPMGLEVFHCLKHDGDGGLSSFSDGFKAAQILFKTSPESYRILATTQVLFEYIDPGDQYYSCVDVILGHNKYNGILERLKFNFSDMRSPINIPIDSVTKFYTSLLEFSNIVNSITKWTKLKPGTIILFDNWRLLHGRSQFTGNRVFATIYLGRSDWLSKARLLGVIGNL